MCEVYDYREAVKNDVIDYIDENINLSEYESLDELSEKLNDELFNEDSVTGNASGSYYCNSYSAEEALCHNWDLLVESAENFGIEPTIGDGYEHGPEYWDVTIRCYLLPEVISEALEEEEEEFEKAHENENQESEEN